MALCVYPYRMVLAQVVLMLSETRSLVADVPLAALQMWPFALAGVRHPVFPGSLSIP